MSKCVVHVESTLHGAVQQIYPYEGTNADALEYFSDSAIMAVLRKAREGDVDALR